MGSRHWTEREDELLTRMIPLDGPSPAKGGNIGTVEDIAMSLSRTNASILARWYVLRNIRFQSTRRGDKGNGVKKGIGLDPLDKAIAGLSTAIDDALLTVMAPLPLAERIGLLEVVAEHTGDKDLGLMARRLVRMGLTKEEKS